MDNKICITDRERLVLIQTLLSPKEKGKKYEERRARRRVSEALGVRRGQHWDVFTVSAGERTVQVIGLGVVVDGRFKRATKLADRAAVVNAEALDLALGAIDRQGAEVDDEDALLDLEEKLRALKEGKQLPFDQSLPGVDDPSDGDVLVDDAADEESLAPDGAVTT